jgi:hypothetical protein
LAITQVETTCRSFNPSNGADCSLSFHLSRQALVTVTIVGPNHEEIARIADQGELPAGRQTVAWDGRDRNGNIVPDEAYFFVLQAVSGTEGVAIDPLTCSGGERVIAVDVRSLEDGARLSYQLPKACRVLVRAGVVKGPLVKTIVNWQPRTKGLILENWDGRDSDNLRHILEIPDAKIAVMAYALPDLSVITTGNEYTTYREYYLSFAKDFPVKPPVVRPPMPAGAMSTFATLPPHLNKDPVLSLELMPMTDAGENVPAPQKAPGATGQTTSPKLATTQPVSGGPPIPQVGLEGALLKVEMPDPIQRRFMNDQKFELIIYVDDRRVLEVEQGHVPFSYPWRPDQLTPGRHLLTINVASFRNHVGTVSKWVEVVK